MKKKKLRRLGDITADLEPLILEMVVDHDLQYHEILGIIFQYLEVHCPGAKEVYTKDGSSPVFYYGSKERLK